MATPTRSPWLALAAAAALLLLGCNGGSDAQPTANQPTATAGAATAPVSPSPQATPSIPVSPSPQPTDALPASLHAVVNAVINGDAAAIRAITIAVPTPCPGPPYCPDGGPAGTYPIIRATSCEPILPHGTDGHIEAQLASFTSGPRTLLAVFEETLTEPAWKWIPRGTHQIVVWRPRVSGQPGPSVIYVRDDKITGIEFNCGWPVERFYEGVDASRFLYGPVPPP